MKRNFLSIPTSIGFAVLVCGPSLALAQIAPDLGTTAPYSIVSNTFSNSGPGTTIDGNVCYTIAPATVPTYNFLPLPPVVPCPAQTGLDQTAALAVLNGQPCLPLPAGPLDAAVIGANPPGTIPPGCYFRAGAIDITASTTVTLSGAGVFIFRSTGGAVTTGANSNVVLAGGACANNVYWAPVGEASLGADSSFVGNILDAAGVSFGLNSTLEGRALAFGGTVTTGVNAATITVPNPACAAIVGGTPVPALPVWAIIALMALLTAAGYAAMRRRTA